MRSICSVLCTVLVIFGIVIAPSLGSAGQDRQAAPPVWQVLVYLDADNNLDTVLGGSELGVVETDLAELMEVGSTENVDVFTLVDRYEGPATLYRVWPGSLEEMTDYDFHGKEANMGDPKTLRSFVSYAFNESEAQRTIIIFWDHGTPYYIALDDNPGDVDGGEPDSLTHAEVIEALDGFHIDIIGADECLVGQTEVAYQYARSGGFDFLVASECYTGWRGIAYDAVVAEIDLDRDITARELAIAMTEHFTEQFNHPPYKVEMVNSKAAVDLSCMDALAASLMNLADVLMVDMSSYYSAITAARGASPILYGGTAITRFDLGNLLVSLSENVQAKDVKDACEQALAAYEAAVMAIGTTKVTETLHTGLGIFLPLTPIRSQEEMLGGSMEEYMSCEFAQLGWKEFIAAYLDVHGGLQAGSYLA